VMPKQLRFAAWALAARASKSTFCSSLVLITRMLAQLPVGVVGGSVVLPTAQARHSFQTP
jgi:hypothetical protein